MSVSACVGDYAKTPYEIISLETKVWCVEELCYCLRENAFLLDASLMNSGLVNWIGDECGLKDLAAQLYPLVRKQGSLSAFVAMIEEYVALYDEEMIWMMSKILKYGAGLSHIEKRKKQIDYLVTRKKYAAAIRSYDYLLDQWDEMEQAKEELPEIAVKGEILHNKAVALCSLMLYGAGAGTFMEAYDITGDKEEYAAYLAAKRMELSEDDYIAFAADEVEHFEETLALEKKMEELAKDFEQQEACHRLTLRKEWRQGSGKQNYYEDNDLLLVALKNEYKENVYE